MINVKVLAKLGPLKTLLKKKKNREWVFPPAGEQDVAVDLPIYSVSELDSGLK